jgi:hypothetical protein
MAQAMHLISEETSCARRPRGGNLDKIGGRRVDGSTSCAASSWPRWCASRMKGAATALAPIQSAGPSARRQAFEDTLWAIFNSKEFLFNH